MPRFLGLRFPARLIAVAALLLAAGLAWMGHGWAQFQGPINALGVDLARPTAWIDSQALSALPKDLVRAPLLRQVLSEDFAFYYEEHEDRLGLVGAIKRIAYEHEQTWSDRLLALALDEPAELAFWNDAKGAPRHWALALTRGALAKVLQNLGSVAAKDSQLSLIAEIKLSQPRAVTLPVFALNLSPRRTLALMSLGNQVLVLSDPGLLFNAERQADERALAVAASLLTREANAATPWRQGFGLGPRAEGTAHRLVADGALLALGYQHFMPGLQALRLDLAPGGASLKTWVRQAASPEAAQAKRAAGTGPTTEPPWRALPVNPAACAVLPLDWERVRAVMSGRPGSPPPPAVARFLAQQFGGSAAVCWYARSQLHTPLLVAHAQGPAPSPAALAEFLRWWMPKDAAVTGAGAAAAGAATAAAIASTRLEAPWAPAGKGGTAAYQPRLAREGDWWLFSPDGALVSLAADALARRYPSVNDTLPTASPSVLALATPSELAELLRREAMAVLPSSQALLRQAADTHLAPRLATLAQWAPVMAVPGAATEPQGWTAVDWLELPRLAR